MTQTRAQIAQLLADGWSPQAIAEHLGLASATVSYHIDRLRSPPPVRTRKLVDLEAVRRTVRTRERVAELLSQGLSRLETARRLRLSKATVSYHARRLGLPVDERGAAAI
jgi:DNA-binding NarL/FixJ family response regulator